MLHRAAHAWLLERDDVDGGGAADVDVRGGPRADAAQLRQLARIGAVRRVSLGLGTFEERMIAWEPGTRFSFSIDGASVPLARRIVEDWRLSPIDGGKTKLDWSMVVAPTLLSRMLRPALEPMMKRMFRKSSEGLERYLLA